MAFRPMNQRFKRGLGGSGGNPQTTTTPAGHPQHGTSGNGPRRPATHGLVGVREQRTLIVKAIATRSDCQGVPSANRGSTAGPLHAYAPARELASIGDAAVPSSVGSGIATSSGSFGSSDTFISESPSFEVPTLAVDVGGATSSVSSEAILAPVKRDMETMNANLRNVVGNRHPMLMAAADQIFGAGGKKLRPAIVFLVARATAELLGLRDITEKHRRLAEITEMIHTASLVHDDVLDDCSLRRGKTTVNSLYGTRVAVLAGDFLFAQSSWFLANLDNLEVIKLISQVIADFANGEISQAASLFDTDITLQQYMDKSFYKTATLIAASCRSAAVFSGGDEGVKNAMFEYGRHLGLAFQVVDDILDFTQSAEQLGKPQGQDLASGNLTAPVVFALQSPVGPELEALIQDEFQEDGALDRALALVHMGGGLAASRQLARQEADLALATLSCLPDCEAKRSMEMMVDYVLDRLY